MKLQYNPNDKNSIIEYAKKLKNKSLRNACSSVIEEHTFSGKGEFGQILEKYYFGIKTNSKSEPDFIQVGLELKSSPLKRLKNEEYRSKERLVLNIINYFNVVKQNFEKSDFYSKNKSILLIFYLHDKNNDVLDYLIKLVDEWQFPLTDLEIINKDWETINQKIKDGKAHEISEGDTFYLGACTKGANALKLRKQPFSDIEAKQRAYSFKQGYVNHIIATISNKNSENGTYGKLISDVKVIKNKTLESIVFEKFNKYLGLPIEEIVEKLKIKINPKSKNYFSNITKAILGIEITKEIEEFQKAEIILKTVRIKSNNLPKEDISFPYFKFNEIINENEWENSSFYEILEHKFLFIFFKYENNNLILNKVKFWNMPYKDRLKAKEVWIQTKKILLSGEIVKEVKNNTRFTNFPNKKLNNVAHVRPHAKNKNDTCELPINDKLTFVNEYTKHCFWLNNSYVKDYIYNDLQEIY